MKLPTVVPCPLRAVARRTPDAPAFVTPEGDWSYARLDGVADVVAAGLGRRGLGEGDRVAFYLPRSAAYLALLLGALRAGVVACPLSTRLPAARLGGLLKQVGARLLVTGESRLVTDGEGTASSVCRPETLLRGEPARGTAAPEWVLGRPATILFTTGSTGAPKGVLHTLGNHYASALGSNANIAVRPADRWLLALPLYHVGGLSILFRCLLAGAAAVLPEAGEPVGAAVGRYGATHLSLVATQLRRLLDEDVVLGGVRAVLLGGSAVPERLIGEALASGLPVHTTYGLTEMASQVTTTPPGADHEALRSAGRPLPFREVRLADDGEILVRGATRFTAYVLPEETVYPFDAEGWFATRDLGRFDDAGRLHVAGRKDHLFISGGENIQPEAIEEALAQINGVYRAVVVPVPDAVYGQRPVAFVERREGVDDADMAAHLRDVLPRFMVPDAFYPWPPSHPKGLKSDRTFLRSEALRLQQSAEAPEGQGADA